MKFRKPLPHYVIGIIGVAATLNGALVLAHPSHSTLSHSGTEGHSSSIGAMQRAWMASQTHAHSRCPSFSLLDNDHNGFVSFRETLDFQLLHYAFSNIDSNLDGKISRGEYRKWTQKHKAQC
jgi:hypothetical protein